MKKKKAFLFAAIAFLLLLFYASYDISQRTTFPGSKGQLKERINKTFIDKDSSIADSVGKEEKKLKK